MLSEAQMLASRVPEPIRNSSPDVRRALLARLKGQRSVMETLCRPLSAEECLLSTTEDTSPAKWHLAHTTWFFEHFILKEYAQAYSEVDPHYEYLFNSYYRSVGSFLPKNERSRITKPSHDEVMRYRHCVTESIASLIQDSSLEHFPKIARLIELGINHEQQHQELLLMDIKQNFFLSPGYRAYAAPTKMDLKVSLPSAEPEYSRYHGGLVKIGKDSSSFQYDNEGGRHLVWIEPFFLSPHLVTNQEYLEFMNAGAYENPRYWLSDGWDWIQKNKINSPQYWLKQNDSYQVMTLSGLKSMRMDEPVSHVSYYEAQAYANFKNARLPTEFEWEHAASLEPAEGNFLETQALHPVPSSATGKHPASDFHGNLWEWTQSAYLPYPGYQALDQGLFEYNSKFMCNQFVLRGGSCVTPKDHYRTTYRNFYYPHHRWQFSGFRLAKDVL